MFPIDETTSIILAAIAAGPLLWLADRAGTWAIVLWMLGAGLAIGLLPSNFPGDPYNGLQHVMAMLFVGVGVIVGLPLSAGLAYLFRSTIATGIALAVIFVGASGWLLWRQFIPSECLDRPVVVRIAEADHLIHVQDQASVLIGDRRFSMSSRSKIPTARFCRTVAAGPSPLEVDQVSMTLKPGRTTTDRLCEAANLQEVCRAFPESQNQSFASVTLSDNDAIYPERSEIMQVSEQSRSGDVSQGAHCDEYWCHRWQGFGVGGTLWLRVLRRNDFYFDMSQRELFDILDRMLQGIIEVMRR